MGAFLVGALAAFAPLALLAELAHHGGGPEASSLLVRIMTIGPSVLVGALVSFAYRDASSMPRDRATALAAESPGRWWEPPLAAVIFGSWSYVLLVIGGRVLDGLGLIDFEPGAWTIGVFAAIAFAAAAAGAVWYSRPAHR